MREEFVTAFLSYLLSPRMDHGLGYAFLSRLMASIANTLDAASLKELESQFKSQLRGSIFQENGDDPIVELEFNSSKGFIDIVIRCGKWFIMIENKIIQASKKSEQIKSQYQGFLEILKGKESDTGSRILLIYLVPASTNGDAWSISPGFYEEMDKVILRDGDYKALVSWQPAENEESPVISIVNILREILRDDSQGLMTPMSTEVRHVLISLIDFALGEFHGFHYERAMSKGPDSVKCRVSELLEREGDLYVGIRYGKGGIVSDAWRNQAFANRELSLTEVNTSGWQYVPLHEFKIYAKWAMDPENNSLEGVKWGGAPFCTQNLYRAAKHGKTKFYVGIKGGKKRLKSLEPQKVRDRKVWQLLDHKKSSDWIPADEFCKILEELGVVYK